MDTLKDFVARITHPWLFMLLSARFLPGTVLQLIKRGDWRTLVSPAALNEAWFGNFWAFVGPQVKTAGEPRVVPLLEGRVHDGQVTAEPVGPPISGVVLEIGAGTGMWADVFAKVSKSAAVDGGLQRVYGIEPNPQSAATLTQRVKELGLQDLYQVVPVGIEQLNDATAWGGRIEPGSVDCIVTILCLCSIPEPEKNIRLLYECLKKGGRWYAYEHVRCERGGYTMRFYQWFTNLFWSNFIGSCRICRATGKTLREVGPWDRVDLTQPPDEPAYAVLPHVFGTLTK
ncbi:S-adenosyl-L-methionine-dependent methyltransferase [Thelonectria olida]|uniref:S-adenosyl-L-methionine-dependent methyltransferase n=1 Tax=Thelonectria olida TaxID=1576542 RepID=A0A9P9AR55_9HYPO|nr:S-adenosyl-L-methionine-dependent methyltransferase [Thelonectria olida]